MKKIVFILFLFLLLPSFSAEAKWLFSSKTKQWINLKNQPSKITPKAQFDYAKSLEEKEDFQSAIEEYEKVIKYFSLSPLVSEARYHMGICYESLGMYYQAFKQYQTILKEDESFENINAVIKREYQIGNLFFSGERKKMFGKIPTITSPINLAEEVFEDILKNVTYSEYSIKSLFKLAEIQVQKKKYKEAILKFKQIINEYNNPDYSKSASFQIALCKYKMSKSSSYEQKMTQETISEFETFLKHYPNSEFNFDANEKLTELKNRYVSSLWDKAMFYESQNKPEAAIIYYSTIATNFSDLEISKDAAQKIDQLQNKE